MITVLTIKRNHKNVLTINKTVDEDRFNTKIINNFLHAVIGPGDRRVVAIVWTSAQVEQKYAT